MDYKFKFGILFFIIILVQEMKFFKNIFDISFRPYHWRLIRSYGDCDRLGYGFTSKIYDKYKIQNIRVLNFENYSSVDSLFYNNNEEINKNHFILINYDEQDINKRKKLSNFPYSIRYEIKINDNYKVIEKDKGCYFIKSN